jgi:hypothetical protein
MHMLGGRNGIGIGLSDLMYPSVVGGSPANWEAHPRVRNQTNLANLTSVGIEASMCQPIPTDVGSVPHAYAHAHQLSNYRNERNNKDLFKLAEYAGHMHGHANKAEFGHAVKSEKSRFENPSATQTMANRQL